MYIYNIPIYPTVPHKRIQQYKIHYLIRVHI